MHVVACRYDRPALEALLAREVDVTLVVDAWESENRPLTPEFLERFTAFHVVASFDDMAAMSQLAVRLLDGPPVDKVLSLAEYGQLGGAYLAYLLGHESPSIRLSVLVRDKRAMKRMARESGVPCARQALVEPATAAEAMGHVGYPAVLKPASGMGTVDTWLVKDHAELEARLAESGEKVMIAEEYVVGEEYHVDAVWRDGRAVAFGVGRYPVPRLQITTPGHKNGSALLSRTGHSSVYDALEELSQQVNKAFGIDSGITHAEFFHTPDGRWLFSEIATRPGGGAIPAMFSRLGIELRDIWMRVETDPSFSPDLSEPPAPYVGWVNIAPNEHGVVVNAPTEGQCRAFDYVVGVTPGHRPGDRVRELHPSIWSWMVEYTADTWEQFLERGAELEQALAFEMEPESDA